LPSLPLKVYWPEVVVVHVEGVVRKLVIGSLGEHEDIALHRFESGSVLVPEVDGHFAGHVAAETVDVGLSEPELHGVGHGGTHCGVGVVELIHVSPVVRAVHLALVVAHIPVGVVFHPGIVAAGVVRHPVDYYLHAGIVSGLHHSAEVIDISELGVDAFIIADGIVAA